MQLVSQFYGNIDANCSEDTFARGEHVPEGSFLDSRYSSFGLFFTSYTLTSIINSVN